MTIAEIIAALLADTLSVSEAIAILASDGISIAATIAAAGAVALANYLRSHYMAAGLPTIGAEQLCKTGSHGKGTCCRALKALGEARMAEGFTYTDCSGKLRCARCWVVASTSKHHPGRHVFKYRGATGCGGGCPEVAGAPLSPGGGQTP
jgi:hypothetical protein